MIYPTQVRRIVVQPNPKVYATLPAWPVGYIHGDVAGTYARVRDYRSFLECLWDSVRGDMAIWRGYPDRASEFSLDYPRNRGLFSIAGNTYAWSEVEVHPALFVI